MTRPGGWVAVTDEVEHHYEWIRAEHADVWLGFREDQVAGFFGAARLQHHGYAPLGAVMHPVHDVGRRRAHRDLLGLGPGAPSSAW